MATPVQPPPTFKKVNSPYDTRAPTGVEAENKAMNFLQSDREREVERRDVVSAKAVGAGLDL
jgi:hypothetical protein